MFWCFTVLKELSVDNKKRINKCDGKMCSRCCYNCEHSVAKISSSQSYHCDLYDTEVDAYDTCDSWE